MKSAVSTVFMMIRVILVDLGFPDFSASRTVIDCTRVGVF